VQATRGTSLTDLADGDGRLRAPARRVPLLAATAAAVLLADLVTKAIVVHTLADREPVSVLGGLVYLRGDSRNTGAAFSLAEGQTVLLSLVAFAVVVAIARTARRLGSSAWATCLGLILGGALGNLVDRVFRAPGPLRGAVVDWIDFRVFPVFNVADSCLVVGVCLAVLLELQGRRIDGSHAPRRRDAVGD